MWFQSKRNFASFAIGNRVRIRESRRSPYPGQCGVVSSIDPKDGLAPYLVRFEDGMQFRYKAEEFESMDRIIKSRIYKMALTVFQVLSPGSNQPRLHSVPPRFGTRQ
jgi:hypothetical protein